MGKVNPKFIGLSQYKAPFSMDLGGRHFHLVMDDVPSPYDFSGFTAMPTVHREIPEDL